MAQLEHFAWGQDALGVNSPGELQRRGVNVFYAPNIRAGIRVVNLETGGVQLFQEEQPRPKIGYFADLESVIRYCERAGAACEERDGLARVAGVIRPSHVHITVENVPNTGSPDGGRVRDLRQFATAFEAREYLPELAAWLSDDMLRQVRIFKGPRFERNRMYFDLDNPERGLFVASGDEGFIADHTYVCRDEVMEDVWTQLITWRQPLNRDQMDAIEAGTEETAYR